jgi:hypothetical protein
MLGQSLSSAPSSLTRVPLLLVKTQNIEKVQRIITRMIVRRCFRNLNSDIPSYPSRINLIKLQTLEHRRNIADITFFHSIHHSPEIISPQNRRTRNLNSMTRGNNIRYVYNYVRTNTRRNSFFIRAPKLFNRIPFEVQNIQDTKLYRVALTRFLTENPLEP